MLEGSSGNPSSLKHQLRWQHVIFLLQLKFYWGKKGTMQNFTYKSLKECNRKSCNGETTFMCMKVLTKNIIENEHIFCLEVGVRL